APRVPVLGPVHVDQAKVRLVDQGRGLERLPGLLARQARGGELAQLVVDEREQLGGGAGVAGLDGGEDFGDVGHAAEYTLARDVPRPETRAPPRPGAPPLGEGEAALLVTPTGDGCGRNVSGADHFFSDSPLMAV